MYRIDRPLVLYIYSYNANGFRLETSVGLPKLPHKYAVASIPDRVQHAVFADKHIQQIFFPDIMTLDVMPFQQIRTGQRSYIPDFITSNESFLPPGL